MLSLFLHICHIRTAQHDIIKVFYSPTNGHVFVLKTTLIFLYVCLVIIFLAMIAISSYVRTVHTKFTV